MGMEVVDDSDANAGKVPATPPLDIDVVSLAKDSLDKTKQPGQRPDEPEALEFNDKPAEKTLDKEKHKDLTPSELAENLKKNNGFGERNSPERQRNIAAIESALQEQLEKGGTALKDYINEVNKALAGSGMQLNDRTALRSRDNPNGIGGHTTMTDATVTLQVKNGNRTVDGTMMSGRSSNIYDQTGKLVGGSSSVQGEFGGHGGGWGVSDGARNRELRDNLNPREKDKNSGGKGKPAF